MKKSDLLLTLLLLLTANGVSAQGAGPPDCPQFQEAATLGQADIPGLTEASGLAASREHPGLLWTHNDSGNAPTLFALESDGTRRAVYTVSGITNQDWEDLSIGPGPLPGKDYLYLADMGDNAEARSSITVYRVLEPEVPNSDPGDPLALPGAVSLEFEYPDGAHDAETLLVDPAQGDLYIVTKDRSAGVSGLYRAAYPQNESGLSTLEHLGDIPFAGNRAQRLATGGDISATGEAIVIRTYLEAHLWPRSPGESIAQTLQKPRCTTFLALEPQGEAIAFTPDGQAFITLSEGTGQPIYQYTVIPATSLLGPSGVGLLAGFLTLTGFHRAL